MQNIFRYEFKLLVTKSNMVNLTLISPFTTINQHKILVHHNRKYMRAVFSLIS